MRFTMTSLLSYGLKCVLKLHNHKYHAVCISMIDQVPLLHLDDVYDT
jgi:hypothetical protein